LPDGDGVLSGLLASVGPVSVAPPGILALRWLDRFLPDGGGVLSGLLAPVGPVSVAPPGVLFTGKQATD
jgi:hypothetical protein